MLEAQRIKRRLDNHFERVVHVDSRVLPRTKKCGEPPPHSTRDPRSGARSNWNVPSRAGRVKQRQGGRRRDYARGGTKSTPSWRPRSPARWEKKRSLSQRVQDGLIDTSRTPAARACEAMSARRSTGVGR